MADEHQVHVIGWPREPASLKHHFSQDNEFPVSVSFGSAPAQVVISSLEGNPLALNMNMALRAAETLPICISPCEPICAESDYTIRISIFDRPMITVRIRGLTRLFGTSEEL